MGAPAPSAPMLPTPVSHITYQRLSMIQPTMLIDRLWPECGGMDSQEKYTSID